MRLAFVSPLNVALLSLALCFTSTWAAAALQLAPHNVNPTDHQSHLYYSSTGDDDGGGGGGGGGGEEGGGGGDNGDDNDDGGGSELQNWSSLIGIVTAIVGNTFIALALNVQRYAHVRLQKRRLWAKERAKQALARIQNGTSGYGTMNNTNGSSDPNDEQLPLYSSDLESRPDADPDTSHEADPLSQSIQSDYSAASKDSTTYLKDPYWWTGQVLITVGETGNFLAYGFAPASIVSPLGVVTLVANCVFAPMMFHERFRARDFWGVIIAVFGVVTVVLSANQKETKLGPHEVWDAITTLAFELYVAISCCLIACLMWLSPRYGNRTILIDLGLVGLFGAYTALSTKGVSSMLSSTLFGAFATPVTYALIFVLLVTAIMQIRYLNKALQRFDSTQVIPIQFVLFTLSVILGSAVLYRDFEQTTAEQALKFVGGCLLTFFGVFLITSGRPPADDDDERLSDDEDIEETLRLSLQNSNQRPAPVPVQPSDQHQPPVTASRRSSKSSKVGFLDNVIKPFSPMRQDDHPQLSEDVSGASSSRSSLEASPLGGSPWKIPTDDVSRRPLIHRQSASVESVVIISEEPQSVPCYPATEPVTPHNGISGSYSSPAGYLQDAATPTTTPRGGLLKTTIQPAHHHHHHSSHHLLINPSPLSSTVNAMIGESLLGDGENPIRRASVRRSRPSLRSSLFVPQDELSDEEGERAPLFSHYDDEPQSAPTAGEPLGDEGEEESNRGLRGRARSLSNTLNEFFGSVRLLRRNTSPAVNTLGRARGENPGG
ncbi:putative magnesium transporter NIPA7 [Zalerion maritima]|uniref:Magnesium transporter NIPA7 n=1 Tax=Zalerion maritima TaxID=339359 RepID=A0AAD5RWV7_9PEZI|nr:putative magnesium transporter NIPA7 [Zalerion maritima]